MSKVVFDETCIRVREAITKAEMELSRFASETPYSEDQQCSLEWTVTQSVDLEGRVRINLEAEANLSPNGVDPLPNRLRYGYSRHRTRYGDRRLLDV